MSELIKQSVAGIQKTAELLAIGEDYTAVQKLEALGVISQLLGVLLSAYHNQQLDTLSAHAETKSALTQYVDYMEKVFVEGERRAEVQQADISRMDAVNKASAMGYYYNSNEMTDGLKNRINQYFNR